jgi:Icc-related predicted phosphoesterase
MRILAFSDIHGAYQKVEDILQREKNYNLIIISGDVTTHGNPGEAKEAVKQFQSHYRPILAVAGNMDTPEIDEALIEIGCSVNGKGLVIEDIGFFGVSAAPFSPLHTPYEISEDEILRRANAGWNDVSNARLKVFIPHAPPFRTKLDRIFLGKHVGSTAVRTFIEKNKPNIVVCGHIHEARGTDMLNSSQMINCGSAARGCYAMIEIGEAITIENFG